jgi:histidinol phosphatase-like enzyme
MAEDILKSGGKIDRTYFSPSLEAEHSILRKPNIGMALLARKEFPGISFKKSVMVGDSISDMVFGKRLKMKTVLLSSDLPMIRKGFRVIDHVYPDLLSFAHVLTTNPII